MLGKPSNITESDKVVLTRYVIYLTLSGSSLLLNGMFLLVLWRSWLVVRRQRITYYVTHLAISDTLVGGSAFGYFLEKILTSSETPFGRTLVVISWTGTLTSLLAVSFMGIERALLITKPHNWMLILPRNRILYIFLGIWVVTMPMAILMHFFHLAMQFVLLMLFYVPLFVTSFVYIVIYRGVLSTVRYSEEKSCLPCARRVNSFQRKVGGFVLLLTVVLLITVIPSFVCLFIKTSCDLFHLDCPYISTVAHLSYYFYMLELTNFVVNPFIYIWRLTMYRKAFCQLLRDLKG